jgi:hypothetical protein
MSNPNFLANGDINPARFVSISGSNKVSQSTLGDLPIAIATDGQHDAPIPGASGLAASSGQPIRTFGQGEYCLLELGEDVAYGALLKPDLNGKGIAADVTGVDSTGAMALESGASGEWIRVQVLVMKGS